MNPPLDAFPSDLQARAVELGFLRPHKYAHAERERRWLLSEVPSGLAEAGAVVIVDLYIDGSRLRLREMRSTSTDAVERKLTKKADLSPDRRAVMTIYLTGDEHALLAALPGRILRKVRRAFQLDGTELSVDAFEGPLAGLVLAEAEFGSDREMAAFRPPSFAVREVTADPRFSGGTLVRDGVPTEDLG